MKGVLTFVLGISLFVSVVSCQNEDTCLCVEPASGSYSVDNPCRNKCHPLIYYAKNFTSFKDNTTFYFLPGTHLMTNVELRIAKVNHLVLGGYGNSTGDSGACGFPRSMLVATVECEGTEAGFHFRDIDYLSITGIRFNKCGYRTTKGYVNTILLYVVWNLCIHNVEIHDARGVGIYGYEVVGNSSISNTVVNSSKMVPNSSSGNIHFYYEYRRAETFHVYYLNITDAKIINGQNNQFISSHRPHAGGIFVYIRTTNKIHIMLKNVTMSGNSGYNGGNAAIDYIAYGNCWLSTITIENCSFLNSSARGFGAGLYTALIADYNNKTTSDHCPSSSTTHVLYVSNSFFEGNNASKVGAGTYIQLHENKNFNGTALVKFTDCHFKNNYISSSTEGRGGSAVNIINFRIPDYTPHLLPQYSISFISCNFTENDAKVIADASVGSSAFYVEENAVTILRDCQFLNNKCTGLSAVESNLLLEGNIEIFNNTAISGGGIVLCANSVMYLHEDVTVIVRGNHATQNGGGIYTEFECAQAIPPCFFQVQSTAVALHKTVFLEDNTANRAGSALYGGSIDNCYFFGPYNNVHREQVFHHLFNITSSKPNDTSVITSNPVRVCFCEMSTKKRNCSKDSVFYNTLYSGGTVSVYVAVVGQRNGTVPGVVMAKLAHMHGVYHTLGKLQGSQVINSTNCTHLKYTLYSNSSSAGENGTGDYESIALSVQNSNFRRYSENESRTVDIKVNVFPCPPGFTLSEENPPVCQCLKELKKLSKHVECIITTTSIHRPRNSKWWFGFIPEDVVEGRQYELLYHKHCPFDYCVSHSVDINTTIPYSQDIQCANERSGKLCGGCQNNLSNVLASNKCADCRKTSFVVVPVTVLSLFLAGIILVLLIANMDLSVSEGRLNGMAFYMNVVSINSSFFDEPSENRIVHWLKSFVAWMNLDLGIEMCFYDGMGAVGKTALEFVFPLYLWCLSGLIIYCGRRSSLIMKIFGKNTVKVLATIILLSYAKLLRTVIDIWNVSIIKTSSGKDEMVWTINGNVHYFHENSHTVLFALAVVVVAITLPYTLALLFIQCLRKKSNIKLLFWVNKLKPFFDAYTGPYKDKYHFWTGFLLIVRMIIFIGIAVNNSNGPIFHLTLIIATTSLLLLLIQPGIYKTLALNIVEAFTYFNLITFTALTTYNIKVGHNNNLSIELCVGSMFLLFCGIFFYHVYKRLSDTRRFRIMKVWLLDKRWPWMKRKPIRSLVLPYIDPDNIDELSSSSDSELDPLLMNAPPLARYDEYREPLIETEEDT